MKDTSAEIERLFLRGDCGDSCLHFDAKKGRCVARSVKAQSHYHMLSMGKFHGKCDYYTPRKPGQKGTVE